MRTPDTRTPSASRTSTASGCPPASDAMVAGAHPSVAVDGIVLQDGKLVAVRRKNEPYRGMPALPGGFVELGETTVDAVVREVREETGLDTRVKRLVGVFSDPRRDPRGHVISIVYELEVGGGRLKAGSDAAAIERVNLSAVPGMAFDHNEIVRVWRGLWSSARGVDHAIFAVPGIHPRSTSITETTIRRPRPLAVVSAPARVIAAMPNAANRETMAAKPARIPAREPAVTLTHKIHAAAMTRKTIDKAYGNKLSAPAARTGTERRARKDAIAANRILYGRPYPYSSR